MSFKFLKALCFLSDLTTKKSKFSGFVARIRNLSCQQAITSSGTWKGESFLADVNTQLKRNNDIKVDTNSNLSTSIVVDEPASGLKAILSFKVPDQRYGKLELQYLHDYAGICTSIGLTANPIVNFSGVVGTNITAIRRDVSFDTKIANFTKYNARIGFANSDLSTALALTLLWWEMRLSDATLFNRLEQCRNDPVAIICFWNLQLNGSAARF